MSSCCSCTATKCAPAPATTNPARDALTQRRKTLAAAADRLGMTVEDLRTSLQKGATLNRLAAARGVAHDDLIATIAGVLAPDQTGRSSKAVTDAAESIAAGRTLKV